MNNRQDNMGTVMGGNGQKEGEGLRSVGQWKGGRNNGTGGSVGGNAKVWTGW